MKTININGTEDTPAINFNYDTSEFIISGRSLPEDVSTFYKPIIDWLDECSATIKDNSKFEFKLEYFNTASSKILLDLFMKLEEITEVKQTKLSIIWFYQKEDIDMKEAGEEYAELVSVPFEFTSY